MGADAAEVTSAGEGAVVGGEEAAAELLQLQGVVGELLPAEGVRQADVEAPRAVADEEGGPHERHWHGHGGAAAATGSPPSRRWVTACQRGIINHDASGTQLAA